MTASPAFYRIAQIEFDIRQLVHTISESRAAGKDVARMHEELNELRRELVRLQMQELLEAEAA